MKFVDSWLHFKGMVEVLLVSKICLIQWELQPGLNESNKPSYRGKTPISSKWIQPSACCVCVWPRSQPPGVAAPASVSGCRHFSPRIIKSSRLLCWSHCTKVLTASCCMDRPGRGSHSAFKGPKSCRRVLLLLLSAMCEEIPDLVALTAHKKLDLDRKKIWNNRSSPPWV